MAAGECFWEADWMLSGPWARMITGYSSPAATVVAACENRTAYAEGYRKGMGKSPGRSCCGEEADLARSVGSGNTRQNAVEARKKESIDRCEGGHDPRQCLGEIRAILIKKELLDPGEELVESMLEDLVHYAYFTGCIPKGDVRRLLGLTASEAKERIRAWKQWQDGNRSCQLRQNPFYEEWPAGGDD